MIKIQQAKNQIDLQISISHDDVVETGIINKV